MKIMKSILILVIALLAAGCSKDEGCGCTIISLDANISLKNSEGEDLLNPNKSNAYNERNFKTYHLINGEEKISHTEELLYQDNDSIYRLRVFVNHEGNDEFPITYIDWNETDRDTIKSEIYRTSNQTRAIKFWYNGELVWDANTGKPAQFTIIK